MKNIDEFVEGLLKAKGVSKVSEDALVEMKNDLSARVITRINAVIVDNMPESKLGEFEKLVSSEAKDGEVQKFCDENIPDLQSLLAVDLARFQSIYLGR